jgi:tRNA nucleotidyltransferase (CCA-adding enzyme)
VNIYLVGGAVREIVRGHRDKVKDWDFAIEAKSFDQMRDWIVFQGFEIFVETPQYFTIRARASKKFYFAGMDMSGRTFDFTLCRTEGEYTDGRHPDAVEVGTIKTDLSRRDFTMNAIAMDRDGNLIDPFNGAQDIKDGWIRCVGGVARLEEDALRILRALRFAVQLDFKMSSAIHGFIVDPDTTKLLENISGDRIRDELTKMFRIDTPETLWYLNSYPSLTEFIFQGNLWLEPTTKGR